MFHSPALEIVHLRVTDFPLAGTQKANRNCKRAEKQSLAVCTEKRGEK